MRIGPPVLAIIAVVVFMIPSYLAYEPHKTNESVSWKLGLLAALSAIGVSLAIWRGLRSWLATRSLLKDWLAASTRVEGEKISVPTFVLQHSFRPRRELTRRRSEEHTSELQSRREIVCRLLLEKKKKKKKEKSKI